MNAQRHLEQRTTSVAVHGSLARPAGSGPGVVATTVAGVVVSLSVALAGCGQKGPLVQARPLAPLAGAAGAAAAAPPTVATSSAAASSLPVMPAPGR